MVVKFILFYDIFILLEPHSCLTLTSRFARILELLLEAFYKLYRPPLQISLANLSTPLYIFRKRFQKRGIKSFHRSSRNFLSIVKVLYSLPRKIENM